MKKVLIPTKLDKVVAKILTDAGFEVVQVPDKPILDLAKENDAADKTAFVNFLLMWYTL